MILGLSKGWSWLSYCLAILLALPLFAIVLQSFASDGDLFSQLIESVLPTYIANSLLLMLLVSLLSLAFGVPAAWFIARCQFPLSRYFQWALLLPLAMPAYIVAYVYTDLFDYAGSIQTTLRAAFGWQSPHDYYFPEVRTLGGAAVMLALVLFPYIYLLARSAFMEQSHNLFQAAKLMGSSAWQSFFRLALPMARPALAVGVALVAMETVADFATVDYFAVPTLTTAVYDTWLGYGSLSAAAKLSVLILLVVFTMVGVERFARRKQALYQQGVQDAGQFKYQLKGWRKWVVFGYCTTLLTTGFLIPFLILVNYSYHYFEQSWHDEFWQLSINSLMVATIVSITCVLLALLLMFVKRVSPYRQDLLPSRLVSTGYALPGTVLAIGVLAPLTYIDFAINDIYQWLGMKGPGLLFTGSLAALVIAFTVRFAAIAIGSIENRYKTLSPSYDMAAMTMAQKPWQLFYRIHLPLLRKAMFVGALLVFIESMKELPAALLLKPIGFENLATYVFQYVSDEQLEQGALAAIVIVLVGLLPLIYLNKSIEQNYADVNH